MPSPGKRIERKENETIRIFGRLAKENDFMITSLQIMFVASIILMLYYFYCIVSFMLFLFIFLQLTSEATVVLDAFLSYCQYGISDSQSANKSNLWLLLMS